MKKLLVAAALTLSGCASVGETMETKEPSGVYLTAKSPTAYRDCIIAASAWAEYQVTDRDGGFMFVSPKVAGNVFTALPKDGGSEVTVWGLLGTRRAARQCI